MRVHALGIDLQGQLNVQLAYTLLATAASCRTLLASPGAWQGQDEATKGITLRAIDFAHPSSGPGRDTFSLMLSRMNIQPPSGANLTRGANIQNKKCAQRFGFLYLVAQIRYLYRCIIFYLATHFIPCSAWLARPLPQPLLDQAAAEAAALSAMGLKLREEMGRDGVLQPLATAQAEMAAWLSVA